MTGVRVASSWRSEMRTKLCLKNLKERDHSDDFGVDGRIILKLNFRKFVVLFGLE
jgi:hypothetical protein